MTGGKSGADIRWDTLENGCAITQDAGNFHVAGTTALAGWGHSNGVRSADDFPDGDFTAAVDFKVPDFSASGMIYFRVSSDDGNMAALMFQGGISCSAGRPGPSAATSAPSAMRNPPSTA